MFTAATFARNVVHRGILALFQFLLRFATFSNGLSRYAGRALTDRGGRLTEAQRRSTVRSRLAPRSITDASTLPPGPSRSDRVPRVSHVLIKD